MHRSRILQDPLVFQSKIKKLEQDSVSEASCKTEEENKKIQLVKIFDRCYSAMRAKLRIVPLLFNILCNLYQGRSNIFAFHHFATFYLWFKKQLPRATPCSIYISNGGSLRKHSTRHKEIKQ